MSENEVTIVVTADDRTRPGFDKARAEGRRLAASDVDIKVKADTSNADRKMAGAARERRRLDGSSANININGRVGGIMAAIAAVTAAVAGLGVATAGAVAGLGAVGGVGIGALASGFSGIGGAVTALGKSAAGAGGGGASAARGLRSANHAVARSEHDLAIAQRDSKDAQKELTRAREDAKRQLEDLQQQTEDMALAQKRAALDVEQAKQDLDATIADPHATDLQRRQAALAYQEALQQQEDLGVAAGRLAAEKKAADKAGVEGSDGVAAAHRRVTDTAYGVVQAQDAVKESQTRLGESSGGAAGGANTLAAALAKLSPAGQKFARFLRGFIDGPLKDFRFAGQTALLPGVQKGMETLIPVMQKITPLWESFNKTLGRAVGKGIEIGGKLAEPLLKFADAALKGLAPMGPVLDRFVDSFSTMVDQVTADGSLASAMDGVTQLFDALLQVLPELIPVGLQLATDVLPPLADAVAALAPALGALAIAVMPILVAVLKALVPLFNGLGKFFTDHPDLTKAIVVGMVAVGVAMWALMPIISAVLAVFAGGWVTVIVAAAAVLAGLAAAVIYCYFHFKRFRTVVDAVLRATGRGIRVFVMAVLDTFAMIVNGVAAAFGWVPGIGPKLKAAAKAFNSFRDSVNRALSGIHDKNVRIKINGRDANVIYRPDGSVDTVVDEGGGSRSRHTAKESGGIVGAMGGGPRSGLTMVGEHGRELVQLAPGSRVHSNPDTERMLSGTGGGGTIQVEWVGGQAGDEFMRWLRKNIRITSGSGPGSVQAALG